MYVGNKTRIRWKGKFCCVHLLFTLPSTSAQLCSCAVSLVWFLKSLTSDLNEMKHRILCFWIIHNYLRLFDEPQWKQWKSWRSVRIAAFIERCLFTTMDCSVIVVSDEQTERVFGFCSTERCCGSYMTIKIWMALIEQA